MIKIILFISVFLSTLTSFSTTYYIKPSGSDLTGTGTLTNPWKSLYKATSAVINPGDIIHVSAGTYIEVSKSYLAPGVSIEGEGVNSVIKSTITNLYEPIIYASSPEGTNGNQHISNIKLDGSNQLTSWGIEIRGRSNFSIHDCTIADFDDRGVWWGGRSDNADAPPSVYATGNTFYNNILTNCAKYYIFGKGCLNVGGQEGMLIYNNTITQTGRSLGTNGWPIKYVNDGYLNGCKIYSNTITKEAYDGITWDFAIELFHVSGLEIYDNNIIGSIDLNYQIKGAYPYSLYIHNNTIGPAAMQQKKESGIVLEYGTETGIISNNHLKNLSDPIYFSTRNGSVISDITINNNLCENIGMGNGSHQGCAVKFVTDGSNNYIAKNFFVYNNTFVANPSLYPNWGIGLEGAQRITNCRIINNIIQGFGSGYIISDPTNIIDSLIVRNNDLYLNGFGNNPKFIGGVPTNYINSGNISTNPQFIGGGFFTLQPASACINTGINIGLPFIGSAPDIGYVEFGSNANPIADAGPDQNITLPANTITLAGSGSDPDGSIVAYAWKKIAGPAAGTISNISVASTTVTTLVVGTYNFELTVTDNNGATAKDTIQLIVNPGAANIAPIANAGADQNITLPVNSINLAGTGIDPDGTVTAYLWTKIAGPAAGNITNTNTASTSVTALTAGTYKFELTVTDNSGATGKDTMQVIVNPAPNVAPTANSGPDQNITLPTNSVVLAGSGNDPDGTITAYLWKKIAGPAAGTIANSAAASTSVVGLVAGTYKFELTVTDNSGAAGKDTMLVVVSPAPNIAPTANAGPNQNITLPTNTITLSGSGNDPDGTITAYMWKKIAGPVAGTIASNTAANTTVTAMIAGTYRFELTVTDNSGATGKDTMQVIVNPAPNVAPTGNAGPDQNITLPTNTILLTGSGNDPDGTITAYLWKKIAGPAAGTIANSAAANTSVVGLVAGIYKFELTVTDNSGATGKDTMQVTVNPALNIAPSANAGSDQNITLPINTITLSGNGNDPDGTITAYLWNKISGPAAGTITNNTAAATTVTALIAGTYRFELTVTDNSGATGKDTMQVVVNPAPNIAPTANAGANQNIALPTNTISLTGSGNDPDGTIIDYLWKKITGPSAGIITNTTSVSTTVTALVAGTYSFELTVTDNSGTTGKDTMQVIVNPAANIAPTANSGADLNITLPTNTVTLSGSGNDPDGFISSYLWKKIAGPAAGNITNANTASATAGALVAGTYAFELTVTDNSGATGKDTMQVIVNPAPNIGPTANAGADQNIVLPVIIITLAGSGTDSDGFISAYLWTKISGPAAGNITNPAAANSTVTGLIAGIYKFELTVTDNSGATDKDTMQVIVFAPNIPPIANAGLGQSITLPVNYALLSGSGIDIDGHVITYRWNKIAGPTASNISSATSASTTATGLVAGIYLFELIVTDNNGAIGKDTVQVIVNPANIPPVANAGSDQIVIMPANNVTLKGTGTDIDGTVVAYKWSQVSGPADKLSSVNTATTVLANLIEGTYEFELTVTDNKGATGKDTVKVIAEAAVVPTQNELKLYPNPVVDITTLEVNTINAGSSLLVVITDMQGKTVYQKKLVTGSYNTMEKINMSMLAKGAYIITVYFNAQVKQSIKAIKQ